MVIVTGTKRSGTSMWMQMLIAAGLPHLGEAFPARWSESIKGANPHGFYESRFRKGVFFATNPDPKTGAFVPPKESKRHAVKVFIPGVVRTDLAYIERVVASMRDWREYDRSVRRLYALEDEWLEEKKAEGDPDDPRWRTFRASIPPALEWWFENYELIRDAATRRYPIHLVTYDALLRDPEQVLGKVLPWVGGGDMAKAIEAIKPDARTQSRVEGTVEGVEPEDAAIFDELYRLLDEGQALPASFVEVLNTTQHRLEERWRPTAQRDRDDPRDEAPKPTAE